MVSLLKEIDTNNFLKKLISWFKIASFTGIFQMAIQAINFLSGILIIRLLSTNEYAIYTLAYTMLGTMTILADGGIGSGVNAYGGKVWTDKQKLGVVLVTGLDLRMKFAGISILFAIPILFYLFHQHNLGWFMSLLVILAIIPAFYAALSDTLYTISPELHQDILPLQKNRFLVNLIRLMLTFFILIIFPLAFLAILASGLPQIWGNMNLKNISRKYVNWNQTISPTIRKEILIFVKKLFPGAIYYCVSGQITIWMISFFGSTESIAQIGALGRLMMVLTLMSTLIGILVTPRFIRLPDNGKLLLNRYLAIQFGLFTICLFFIGITWVFSNQILWILGANYLGLNYELVLSVIGGCISLIVGISFSLNSNRGWIINPIAGILLGLSGIVSGALIFDVSTLIGVLYFNIYNAIVGFLIYPFFGLYKITILTRSQI